MACAQAARRSIASAAALSSLVLSGCAGTPHRDAVTGAAIAFVTSLERGDGDAACTLLTPDAQKSVSGATDTPCADAITSIKEQGRAVGRVQVWGDAAQVKLAGDVLFLRRLSGEWRVSAAGCTPQKGRPYDCKVGG